MNPKVSLAIGIVCISFSPILFKVAGAPPIVCAFYRFFFAWIFLLPYCLYKKNLKMANKDIMLALIGGVIFASDMAVWHLSLQTTSATVSTLLANLAPVWVGLLSYLVLKKKSGLLFWIGTGIAIAGMVVLVGAANLISLKFNIGIAYAVAASMFYAIYILITKDILKRINIIPFMFYSMLAACVFLLLINAVLGDSLFHYSLKTWGCFAALGIISQLTGWITINYAISYLESTKVALTLLSQTVIAGFLAVLLLNEFLDLKEIIGSVIILAGIAITFLKSRQLNNL